MRVQKNLSHFPFRIIIWIRKTVRSNLKRKYLRLAMVRIWKWKYLRLAMVKNQKWKYLRLAIVRNRT